MDAPDAEALELGRYLFAQSCEFAAAAASLDGLPPPDGVEVAFAGRSNVGKSSLVNALTGRRNLARTSNTPGRTRQINFFSLAGGRLTLVDLPGYGYAKAAKREIAAWTGLVDAYLRGRPNLRRAVLLVDARRGPLPPDLRAMDMLDGAAVVWQLALTKTDKLAAEALDRRLRDSRTLLRSRPAAYPAVAVTSARRGAGVAELRAELAELATDAQARSERSRVPHV